MFQTWWGSEPEDVGREALGARCERMRASTKTNKKPNPKYREN
jgi:hypothetical protein